MADFKGQIIKPTDFATVRYTYSDTAYALNGMEFKFMDAQCNYTQVPKFQSRTAICKNSSKLLYPLNPGNKVYMYEYLPNGDSRTLYYNGGQEFTPSTIPPSKGSPKNEEVFTQSGLYIEGYNMSYNYVDRQGLKLTKYNNT